jgi:hypothetical protein
LLNVERPEGPSMSAEKVHRPTVEADGCPEHTRN